MYSPHCFAALLRDERLRGKNPEDPSLIHAPWLALQVIEPARRLRSELRVRSCLFSSVCHYFFVVVVVVVVYCAAGLPDRGRGRVSGAGCAAPLPRARLLVAALPQTLARGIHLPLTEDSMRMAAIETEDRQSGSCCWLSPCSSPLVCVVYRYISAQCGMARRHKCTYACCAFVPLNREKCSTTESIVDAHTRGTRNGQASPERQCFLRGGARVSPAC